MDGGVNQMKLFLQIQTLSIKLSACNLNNFSKPSIKTVEILQKNSFYFNVPLDSVNCSW